jgi:hypothetical protein
MVGDHISMDTDFFKNVPKNYQRTTYNVFINTEIDKNNLKTKNREFAQFDMLPTTISALGGNMAGYLQDSAMAHEAEVAEDWARGTFTQLITVVFYASLIFVGAQNCKIKNKNTYIYNAFVIGIMIYEPFRLAGSLTRLFNVLSCLWFIPLSYALYNYRLLKNSSKLTKWAMIPIFLYIVSYFGRYIFLNPDANYIWNL